MGPERGKRNHDISHFDSVSQIALSFAGRSFAERQSEDGNLVVFIAKSKVRVRYLPSARASRV